MKQYDVFISYSRADYVNCETHKELPNNVISKIMDAFDKANISYWIDKEGIHSGDAWAKLIGKAIGGSSVFLFVSSVNSNHSDCWSSDEIALARNKKKHIIPLLLDDTPYNDEFALFIARLDYVDYATIGDAAIPKLVESIELVLDEKNPNRKKIRELKKQQGMLRDEIKRKESERRHVISQLKELGADVNDEPAMDAEEVKRKLQASLAKANMQLKTLSEIIHNLEENNKEKDNIIAELNTRVSRLAEYERREKEREAEAVLKRKEAERNELQQSNIVWFDERRNSLRWRDKEYKLIKVAGGRFTMGATPEQGTDAYRDERPTIVVTLSDFSIGQTAVPQWLWQATMGNNPSYYKGKNLPVEQISWHDCQGFVKKLNELTGKSFSLPTEAQWEFAARGGSKSEGYKYSGSNNIDDVAWYDGNSNKRSHDVATKKPNELGLYDMSGNVFEWCEDRYCEYTKEVQFNSAVPTTGAFRVYRGGCWSDDARRCRVSYRYSDTPSNGYDGLSLRLALRP